MASTSGECPSQLLVPNEVLDPSITSVSTTPAIYARVIAPLSVSEGFFSLRTCDGSHRQAKNF